MSKLTGSHLEISARSFPAETECNALAKRLDDESLKLIEDGPFLRMVPK
jgi:hypothetical protein